MSWTPSKDTDKESPGRPPNLRNKRLILNELQENLEISCRQIARSTKIPYSTVNYTLIHRLNYKSVHTQYVPHILNEDDKMIRIQCCKEILTILKKCQRNGYRYIVTGDESWILYFTPKGCMWIRSGKKPPKAANIGFQCPKVMLCYFGDQQEFHQSTSFQKE